MGFGADHCEGRMIPCVSLHVPSRFMGDPSWRDADVDRARQTCNEPSHPCFIRVPSVLLNAASLRGLAVSVVQSGTAGLSSDGTHHRGAENTEGTVPREFGADHEGRMTISVSTDSRTPDPLPAPLRTAWLTDLGPAGPGSPGRRARSPGHHRMGTHLRLMGAGVQRGKGHSATNHRHVTTGLRPYSAPGGRPIACRDKSPSSPGTTPRHSRACRASPMDWAASVPHVESL